MIPPRTNPAVYMSSLLIAVHRHPALSNASPERAGSHSVQYSVLARLEFRMAAPAALGEPRTHPICHLSAHFPDLEFQCRLEGYHCRVGSPQ